MSEPIKAGDLVMVVRPRFCCGVPTVMGKPFIVRSVITFEGGRCRFCRKPHDRKLAATYDGMKYAGVDVRRLIKIDPPAKGETKGASVRKREPVLVRT